MTEVRTYYYQEGTAAAKPEVIYAPHRNLPTRETREREKREAAARQQKIISRQHKNAMRVNKLMTTYMVMVAFMVCVLFVGYVYLQNDITTRLNSIASLETQLSQINADNKAAESRIATTSNLNEIKNVAINDLGMVYASTSQIVYYNVDSTDYMSQYKDIP